MRLPPDQVQRFYAIWIPLLLWVNRQLHVEPDILDATAQDPLDQQKAYAIREALWANDPIRHQFVAENPAGLSMDDLALVTSWDHRVAGTFYIFRQLKKHALLIRDGTPEVYAVLGLTSAFEDLLPFQPALAKMVLLPFEGQIIYDSLLMTYNISFGAGIRERLNTTYRDAKERGAILTSLGPTTEPVSLAEGQAGAGEVNARVLDVFAKHLYRSGLSPKVVERDAASAAAFAHDYLATRPKPQTLRDFGDDEVRDYLAYLQSAGLSEAQRKQRITGLRRLVRFLRDTERMDYWMATDTLAVLRGRE